MGPIVGGLTPCPRLWRRPAVWTCPTDRRPGSGSRSVPHAAAEARAPGTRGRQKALRIQLTQKKGASFPGWRGKAGRGWMRVGRKPRPRFTRHRDTLGPFHSLLHPEKGQERERRTIARRTRSDNQALLEKLRTRKKSPLNVSERQSLGETGCCFERTSTRIESKGSTTKFKGFLRRYQAAHGAV
jgi:hypothetical protein